VILGDLAKRAIDIVGASAALLVTSPLLAVSAVAVRATMGSPILFRQTRPGLGGRPFVILKLRTMRDATDRTGKPLSDAERLTRLGRFLRSTSLDELPELLNVIRGDMSLVGPRPLLMQYLARYDETQMRRHEVRPGITGWAQVNGRNAVAWEERLAMDVWYVDHRSLWLDLRILLRTFGLVLRRDGVSHAGEATMHEFMGSGGGEGE
jgi:lipopolysaccharide/colanic/teichoic acid biosynthesis glycosyltransferase